jgi:hypothetical protein
VRRLIHLHYVLLVTLGLLSFSACRREEKIKMEPTDESQAVLASTVHAADPKAAMQLTKGFHPVEQNAWRWTLGNFAIAFAPPAGAAERGATLNVKISVPEPVLDRVKKTTLSASIQGSAVGSATYTSAGEQTFSADIPSALLKSDAVTVEFALDPFVAAGTMETRELGIIFVSAGMESK